MIKRPRFKRHYRAEVHSPELVLLFWETGCQSLPGRLHPLLAPLIDGNRTAGQIAELLAGRATELDVVFGLSLLEEEGYIEESTNEPAWLHYFSELYGSEKNRARAQLDTSAVSLSVLGDFPVAPIVVALESMGLHVSAQGTHDVVLVDDYLRSELEEISRSHGGQKKPWLLAKPVGATHWLGPVFDSSSGTCWSCLAMRLKEVRRAEYAGGGIRFGVELRPAAPDPPVAFPATVQLLAMEVFRWVVQGVGSRDLLTLDYRAGTQHRHVVPHLQRCPQCGLAEAPALRPPRPPVLQSRYKITPGDHRTEFPDAVYSRYEHHLSPVLGIVSRLKPYGPAADGIAPAYIADHLFGSAAAASPGPQRRRSAGKGMTHTHAKASALCEALERYSGVYRGDEPGQIASYEELGELAIHPQACLNFSPRQYRERDVWNRKGHAILRVPAPFDERRPVEWSPAWSLTGRQFKYVTSAYCYYGHPLPEDHIFCWPDSNGCAAGSSIEEAILHGLLELVERDAVALWWYNRIARPAVDPECFRLPFIRRFRDHYWKLGREVRLFDIASDFRIPVFAAVSWPAADRRDLILGFGCHFDPNLAAVRALTEANQFLEMAMEGKPRCKLDEDAGESAFLYKEPTGDMPEEAGQSEDLLTDINSVTAISHALGMETLVVDQTRPDIGLSVVKVIIPGLRHFWPRFGPGRLYETPVKMGWLEQSLPEEKLNPAVFFA